MADDEPDFTDEYTKDLCSEEQLAQIDKLSKFGWRVTHLWERTPGEIVPWLIARRPRTELKSAGYAHCYIGVDSKIYRYEAYLKDLL